MAVESNKQLIIDSRFFVPKGVVDMRQDDGTNYSYVYTPATTAVDPVLNLPTSLVPMPPTSYSIVDQHVRISADGTTVVDVTIEFPDITGIDSIDVRITKAQ